MVFVHRLVGLPEGVEEKPWRTFSGKLGDRFPLESMEGLSGGPIFGFNNSDRGKYWIVAIQTEWLEISKITLGCSVPVLARFAEACFFGGAGEEGKSERGCDYVGLGEREGIGNGDASNDATASHAD